MIFNIGGYKGGAGKSTLAVNLATMLARQGRDVALIDADQQGSARLWGALREKLGVTPPLTTIALFGDSLHTEVGKLRGKFDDIVIDTPGRDCPELRSAMLVADVLLTPCQASMFSTATLGFMVKLIEMSRLYNPALQCYLLPNRLHTNRARQKVQLQRITQSCGDLPHYALLNSFLTERVSYEDILELGRSALDSSDAAARFELKRLYEEIIDGRA